MPAPNGSCSRCSRIGGGSGVATVRTASERDSVRPPVLDAVFVTKYNDRQCSLTSTCQVQLCRHREQSPRSGHWSEMVETRQRDFPLGGCATVGSRINRHEQLLRALVMGASGTKESGRGYVLIAEPAERVGRQSSFHRVREFSTWALEVRSHHFFFWVLACAWLTAPPPHLHATEPNDRVKALAAQHD